MTEHWILAHGHGKKRAHRVDALMTISPKIPTGTLCGDEMLVRWKSDKSCPACSKCEKRWAEIQRRQQ